MTPPVIVYPPQFLQASDVFAGIRRDAETTINTLTGRLQDCGGMAGTDDAGHSWSGTYDPAVTGAMAATSDVVTGTAQIADLLSATGINHANADLYSAFARLPTSVDGPFVFRPGAGPYYAPAVPAASGGDNSGGPPGWSIIQKYVGRAWPNGHQDKLHTAATAWRTAADSLGHNISTVPKAVGLLENQQTLEAPAALTACSDMAGHHQDLAAVFRDLAQSCDDYAYHLDEAHHEIIVQLEWLAGTTIFIQGVSWLFPPAEGAEVERLAATGARIRTIIDTFAEAVAGLLPRIAAGAARVGRIATDVAKIVGARVRLFSADAGDGAAGLSDAAEAESYGLEDVDRVAQHLSSRDMDEVTNDAMMARVRDAIQSRRQISEGEQNFMEHELTEARLMDEGMSYDDAHAAALETHPPLKNYDPEVIEQFPDYFNNAWRRAWGLPPR